MKKLLLLIGLVSALENVSAMHDSPTQVTAQVPKLKLAAAFAVVDEEQEQRPGSVQEQVIHVLKDKEQQRASHLLHNNSTAVLYDETPKAPQYNYDELEDDDALEAASERGDEKQVQALLAKSTIRSEDINGAYYKARRNIKPLLKAKYISLFKKECARWSKEHLYLIQAPLKSPMIQREDLEKILQEAQSVTLKNLFILVLQEACNFRDPGDQIIFEKLMFLQHELTEPVQEEPGVVEATVVQNPGLVQTMLLPNQVPQEEPVVEQNAVYEFNEVQASQPQQLHQEPLDVKDGVQNGEVAQTQSREEFIDEFFNKTDTRAKLEAFLQRPKILFATKLLMPARLEHAATMGTVEVVNYLLEIENFTEQNLQEAWNNADVQCKFFKGSAAAEIRQGFIEIKMALKAKLPQPVQQRQNAQHASKACVIL